MKGEVSVASADEETGLISVYAQKSYGNPDGMNFNTCNSDLSYEPFNFEFGPRNLFGGFHGSVYEGSVEAIGVYVKPYEFDHSEDDFGF
ncbi:hypothetical protein Tco_0138367 [Tanacetum coccineum]